MNYLKAVFWDYPQFTDEKYLSEKIKGSDDIFRWILSRFLEYGRAIDTMKYFSIYQINTNIDKIKIRPETRRKWKRLIEVYDTDNRK